MTGFTIKGRYDTYFINSALFPTSYQLKLIATSIYFMCKAEETSEIKIQEHFYVDLLSGQLIVLEDLKLTHWLLLPR